MTRALTCLACAMVLFWSTIAHAFTQMGERKEITDGSTSLRLWERYVVEENDTLFAYCQQFLLTIGRVADPMRCVASIALINQGRFPDEEDVHRIRVGEVLWLPVADDSVTAVPDPFAELDVDALRVVLGLPALEGWLDTVESALGALRGEVDGLRASIPSTDGFVTRDELDARGFVTRDYLMFWVEVPHLGWRVALTPILVGFVLLGLVLGGLAFFGVGPVGRKLQALVVTRIEVIDAVAQQASGIAGMALAAASPAVELCDDIPTRKQLERLGSSEELVFRLRVSESIRTLRIVRGKRDTLWVYGLAARAAVETTVGGFPRVIGRAIAAENKKHGSGIIGWSPA